MATEGDRHIDEATLEKHSEGNLSPKAAEQVEEHLLVCELCRSSLAARDAYVAAMRAAAAKLRRTERKPKGEGARKVGGKG